MGTNYYLDRDTCPTCGHSKERFHLGKSSYRWSFSFRGYRSLYEVESIGMPVLCLKDWLELISTGKIKDEYEKEIPEKELIKLVEEKKDSKFNHTIYCKEHYPEHADRDCWVDEEGNSFSEGDFS